MFLVAYRVTYRVLGDGTRAEDAAAEALARALVSWRRVGRMEHRNGWVARVAGNVAIDEIRRARRRREVPEAGVLPTADGTEEATLRLALGAALAGLSTRQREVISLRYLADLDEFEVSRALGACGRPPAGQAGPPLRRPGRCRRRPHGGGGPGPGR